MVKRGISSRDQRLLWGLAGARCSKPDCRSICVAKGTSEDQHAIIGEIAHIHSASDDGPRAHPELSEQDRNSYTNLILLCANHHTEVDKQHNKYSAAQLREWKVHHENWVEQQLQSSMPSVSFAELEIVLTSIISTSVPPTEDFTLISPSQKIKKNKLTERVAQRIRTGMVKSKEVEDFIKDISKIIPNYPEKISHAFVTRYQELYSQGLRSDELFEAIHEFSAGGYVDFDRLSAGLAVLVYLFEKCEVFEK